MNISIKFFYKIYLLPIFFYLIIFLVVFNKVFFNDNHFISHDNFIQFFVSFKNSTLWESDLGYGFPVFADPQWQLFYPFLYFFPKNLRGFDFYLLHFFIIGAYFTYLFSFYLTKNYLASLVSGLVFALSGSMIGQMSMLSVPAASSYLPVIFYFLFRFLEEKKYSLFFGLVISIGLGFLSGQPQFFIHIVIFVLIFVIIDSFLSKNVLNILYTILALLFGILIVSFAFLPQLELLKFSLRESKILYFNFIQYQYEFKNIINLFFPNFLGGISNQNLFDYIILKENPMHNYHEHFRYFGILPWFLIIFIKFIDKKNLKFFFIFSLIFYLLWAFGDNLYLAKLLYKLPVLNRLRGPSRHFLEITYIFSIITAIGLNKIEPIEPKKIKKFYYFIFIVIFLMPFVYFFLDKKLLEFYKELKFFSLFKNNGLIFQYLVLTIGFVFLISHLKKRIYLLSLVLILDLGINAQFVDALVFTSDSKIWKKSESELKEIQNFLSIEQFDIYRYYFEQNTCILFNVDNCKFAALRNNINSLFSLKSSNVYNPLIQKDVIFFNRLFMLKKELLPQWNIKVSLFDLYFDLNDIANGIPINFNYDFEVSIQNLNQNEYWESLLFFASLNSQPKNDNEKVLKIEGLNFAKEIYYSTDINNLIHNCDSNAFFQKKIDDQCINIYAIEIPIKRIVNKDMKLKFSIYNQNIIVFYGFAIKTKKGISRIYNFKPFIDIDIPFEKKILDDIVVLEFKQTNPRAFFTKKLKYIKESELRTLLFFNSGKFKVDLIEESYIHTNKIQNFSYDPNYKIEWLKETDTSILLKTKTEADSFLILMDLYYPSWKAFLDGKEIPIYPTNLIARGIYIPKGEHYIEFKFFSKTLLFGIFISVITLIILIFIKFIFPRIVKVL